MKQLIVYKPGQYGPREEMYIKGSKAATHPQDFVLDIQILEEGRIAVVNYGSEQSKIFCGIPFEYQEMNEAGHSFYLPKKK